MAEVDEKVCPRCKGEFQSWVKECPDCEIALLPAAEWAQRRTEGRTASAADLESLERAVASDEDLALGPGLGAIYQVGDQAHCVAIANTLAAHGVPFHVAPIYAVYVLPEDFEAADQARKAQALEGVHDPQPTTGDHDEACPACGTKLRPNETECPECGLAFGGV
jgi:hypothetical protein